MPVANGFSRRVDNLLPVIPTAIVGYVIAEVDDTDVIIATEAVVVHDDYLHHQILQVESRNQELE